MINYTKGEWGVTGKGPELPEGQNIIQSELGKGETGIMNVRTICKVFNYCELSEAEANAQLIASAPDLYEKLLKVKKWVEMLLRNAEHQLLDCRFITLKEALKSDIANYQATLVDINKALAKAEGK